MPIICLEDPWPARLCTADQPPITTTTTTTTTPEPPPVITGIFALEDDEEGSSAAAAAAAGIGTDADGRLVLLPGQTYSITAEGMTWPVK